VISWDSEFAAPIDLPNNAVATTLAKSLHISANFLMPSRTHESGKTPANVSFKQRIEVGSIWFARIAIIQALQRGMLRFRRRSWSPEELRLLDKLVVDGASPRTAAEALNTKATVRTKARMIGCPFPHR